MPSERSSELYDRMWQSCASLDAASPAAFHRRRLVVRWAAGAVARPGRILDVGCGEGELAVELARRFPGAHVAGADVSRQALDDVRSRGVCVDAFRLDLEDPRFDESQAERLGSYDLVTCCEVIEHLDDDEAALGRLGRLLGPGGHLIVSVPGGRPTRFDTAIGHRRHYRPDELGAALQRAGLQPERIVAWGFPFHTVYRAAVRVASAVVDVSGSKSGSGQAPAAVPGALGAAYRAFGRLLRPLFYLNLSRWGQQLVALCRRPLP